MPPRQQPAQQNRIRVDALILNTFIQFTNLGPAAGLGLGPGPRHEFHVIGSKPGAAKAAASATKENKGECPYIKHLHTIKKLGPSSRPGPGPGTQA